MRDRVRRTRRLTATRTVLLCTDMPAPYVRAAETAGLASTFELVAAPPAQDPGDTLLGRAEALLAWKPLPGLATRAPRLRWIQSLTGGCEQWLASPDLPPFAVLTCARGTHRLSMPEHILTALFMVAKQIPGIVLDQRESRWRRRVNDTLAGKTLGILGLGAIGAEVARKAAGLDIRVIGTKRDAAAMAHVDRVLGPDGIGSVLAESDYVLLLLPSTTETRGIVNKHTLALIKPSAWLLNFARGDLVVDADLVEAVATRRIAGAVLDVFREEPLSATSPFWTTENIVVFPHVGGLHPERDEAVAELWVDNLRRFAAGQPLREVVDRRRGY
ncbi:MAG: D-2-hydroxyacid dehydrogenase [Candidatus Rokuibacteriota bacterium]|nr:MAG: D-2-hydroxyacid dehydrogenase [Candidatus Rokubacteria bacterium]